MKSLSRVTNPQEKAILPWNWRIHVCSQHDSQSFCKLGAFIIIFARIWNRKGCLLMDVVALKIEGIVTDAILSVKKCMNFDCWLYELWNLTIVWIVTRTPFCEYYSFSPVVNKQLSSNKQQPFDESTNGWFVRICKLTLTVKRPAWLAKLVNK